LGGRQRREGEGGRIGGVDRTAIVDRGFLDALARPAEPAGRADSGLPPAADLVALLESQLLSRHLDFAARAMRARGDGFYTISSAGHEGNAVPGRLLRATDPAFLHYRSGAFMLERARHDGERDPVLDIALSLAASADDPVAGGRHKVWGSPALWVPPQTSTIASHLPKAVGTAIAIAQAVRLRGEAPVPTDSIVACSFGDASVNHAAAQTAFNAAGWTSWQHLPCPILFICEDNGLGISVPSPVGWTGAVLSARPGVAYFAADGLDPASTWQATAAAIEHVRSRRAPACLHLGMVRLLGHAGSDVETSYRDLDAIEADEARDPLIRTAASLRARGILSADAIRERYEAARERVAEAAEQAARRPRLGSAAAVMAPLAPLSARRVAAEAARTDHAAARGSADEVPEHGPPRHLAVRINDALAELLVKYPEMTVFGEDVARKGGVYTVTTGLQQRFGGARVFNTLLDETTILGIAQGQGLMGLLPVPEIQYLAYFHNACDQVRGEAASLGFFSAGAYRNPMVIRVAGLAYQKGFGGHFHNDNSWTALRDIPGLVVACPARGDDAVALLRTLAALARVDGRVCVLLEPIALYMTRDLHATGDGEWLAAYPAPGVAAGFGEPVIHHADAGDLLIITYGNGVPMSLRAARRLHADAGIGVRVMDLRWLKPLNHERIRAEAGSIGRVLVVDEGRRTGGVAEEICTVLDEGAAGPVARRRVCGRDSFVPLGDAAATVLVGEDDILAGARAVLDDPAPR